MAGAEFLQPGEVMQWTNTGTAKVAGAVVVIGKRLGVLLVDIAQNASGSVAMRGVYKVPKVSGAVFVQGENVIFDVSASAFDDAAATPAAGDVSNCALAWKAGANGETTAEVLFTDNIGTVT